MQIYKNIFKTVSQIAKPQYKFSYYNNIDLSCKKPSFKASDIVIKETDQRKPLPNWDPNELAFGAKSTDHMLVIDWDEKNGWEKPVIQKFENFSISPFNSTLHYAIECFEGLKAFHTDKGIRLFRCDANMYRMKNSMQKISLPDFDGAELQKCIEKLIEIDQDWVPPKRGFSLYIRPTGISMEDSLGVKVPHKARIFCVISPVGPYYPSGFKPIKLYCDPKEYRAAPHGTGCLKVGSNYGPTIRTSTAAAEKGFQQVLWLWKDQVCEVGTSNIFFHWINEQGEEELVTPRLDEGYILPGVTRDSILDITRGWGRFKVTERQIEMKEVAKAIKENRLKEAFGAGTAVIVCPIEEFWYEGETYKVPINPKHNAGDLTYELLHTIQNIQYGITDHKNWQSDIKI